jgi:arginase
VPGPQRTFIGIGSPLDCSGSGRGEADAPGALRSAGLFELIGAEDLGDVHGPITDQTRDPASGVLALAQVRDAVRAVRDAVDLVYRRGATPLVVGGDCSMVIGALAGSRLHHERLAACFLDGHVDSYDGVTSPTGEVADMDIGIVCGSGPAALRGLDGAPDPLVRPEDCVVIGNRFEDDSSADESELAHPLIQQIPGVQLRRADAGEIGAAIGKRLALQAGAIWLHIDCDVLDEAVMPAVTYAQPHGATWEELEALAGAVARRAELVGVSIADLVPARDPGGESTARLARLVAAALRP